MESKACLNLPRASLMIDIVQHNPFTARLVQTPATLQLRSNCSSHLIVHHILSCRLCCPLVLQLRVEKIALTNSWNMVSVPAALLARVLLFIHSVNLPESVSESSSKTCNIFISLQSLGSNALTCRQRVISHANNPH